MNTLTFDLQKCTGCKRCYHACWLDVIRWDAERQRPVAAYPADCVDCLFCQSQCPVEALTVVVDYSQPIPPAY